MLATKVRERPWSERAIRPSSGRVTTSVCSSFAIEIGPARTCEREPLGPFTEISCPAMLISTPLGIVIGERPIRDIRSPYVGENFSAYPLLIGLLISEQTR